MISERQITLEGGTVRVHDSGLPVFEQQMFDVSEAESLKKMLDENPGLSPFDCFREWLKFKFPNGRGSTREDRKVSTKPNFLM